MNESLSHQDLKNHIIGFLKEHKEGSLATCLDNKPRSSPVRYFLGGDLDLYVVSAGGEKFKALEENPNLCLLVNTHFIDYKQIKGVQIFGTGISSIEKPELLEEAKSYCKECPQENYKVIKIKPDEIVYLNSLVDGDRTKQILKV